jgi:cell division protease FtsH
VQNRAVLDNLVTQLLERETIDRNGLTSIFEAVVKRAERPAWTGSDTRIPSGVPPVEVPAHVAAGPESAPEITIGPGSEGGIGSLPPMAPPTGPPATGPLPPDGPYGGSSASASD